MHRRCSICFSVLFLVAFPILARAGEPIHHELKIVLEPEKHRIRVQDTLTLPARMLQPAQANKVQFALHQGLHPISVTAGVEIRQENNRPFISSDQTPSVPLERFNLTLPNGQRTFVLVYGGEILHALQKTGEEYGRSFSETPGIISPEGVFLAGISYWYPRFNDDLLTFTMEVKLPEGWKAVSQGQRIREGTWRSLDPQDEIFIVAGRFTEYTQPAGRVQAMAFLRMPDPALASRYLEATAQYLEMYSRLLGPYPYQKFALVENFWETGYGMPSFTLMGPQVIRLPFILHSSYPHEILHNWWGNSVFVDLRSGNWAEGLTAYLADHLIQEQQGRGAEYRRTVLQKYTDYVKKERDFPLTEFRSRHSSATEAVGYGKTMMFFHMLRLRLGDEIFIRGLQKFYSENKFKYAAYTHLERVFSGMSGKDLKPFFDQWINRPGSPELRLGKAMAKLDGEAYLLKAEITQEQSGPAYSLTIPMAIYLEGHEDAYQTTTVMNAKRLDLTLHLPARPVRLDVDPEFDLFRRLDRDEIPPTLSLAFGAEKVLILLPSSAEGSLRLEYERLAETWKGPNPEQIEIKLDRDIQTLPTDRSVWVLGWENQFRDQMGIALEGYGVSIAPDRARIEQIELLRSRHSVVLTARHPANPGQALIWMATDHSAALPGLGRKLSHYGKYSYLGFEGDEPVNIVKGEWPVNRSLMSVWLSTERKATMRSFRTKLAPRRPLAVLAAPAAPDEAK